MPTKIKEYTVNKLNNWVCGVTTYTVLTFWTNYTFSETLVSLNQLLLTID